MASHCPRFPSSKKYTDVIMILQAKANSGKSDGKGWLDMQVSNPINTQLFSFFCQFFLRRTFLLRIAKLQLAQND